MNLIQLLEIQRDLKKTPLYIEELDRKVIELPLHDRILTDAFDLVMEMVVFIYLCIKFIQF